MYHFTFEKIRIERINSLSLIIDLKKSELKERGLVMSSVKINYMYCTFILIALIDNQSQIKLEFCNFLFFMF